MSEIDLISSNLINEIQCGTRVNEAISTNHRADFSLLLAMLSNDPREITPIEIIPEEISDNNKLRQKLEVPKPQPLTSKEESYLTSATIANMFHTSGISSAKLNHYLTPEALCFLPLKTQGLPEEVYHNLSGHTVRHLKNKDAQHSLTQKLYNQLINNRYSDSLSMHI